MKKKMQRNQTSQIKIEIIYIDNIILNDLDINYWIYNNNIEGYVSRIEEINSEAIEKYRLRK